MRKVIIITLTIFALSSSLSQAQIIPIIGGSILLDKAGKEVRDSIDAAREAGLALLDRANEVGRQRLDQIDAILKNTVGGLLGQTEESALKVLAQAKKDIDAVRESIFSDLKSVIWQAECAGKRFVLSDLQEALGGLGSILNTHQIRLSPPISIVEQRAWYCRLWWWCDDPNIIEIKEPFGDTYILVRDRMETFISSQNIQETTPAHRIVGTYEYLSAFALKTSCFYPGSSDAWNRESIKYREMAHKWRQVVNIAIE